MHIYDNELTVFVDVDDTLLMHDLSLGEVMDFTYPYGAGRIKTRAVHAPHVSLIKDMHSRGYSVFVWSAAGALWAAEAVTKLGLKPYVKACMTKPIRYIDDLTADQFTSGRIFLPAKPT